MREQPDLPVVVIGAGPAGLTAAAHLRARDLPVVVLEAGNAAGAAVREWGHVRLFSSWAELVDPAARALLESTGWEPPNPRRYPTGNDWVGSYLQPLADVLDESVRLSTKVLAVTRAGRDRLVSSGRETSAFVVHVETPDGRETVRARAVVDASGTWTRPNPLGSDGFPAIGETENASRISYRMPDLADDAVARRYAGKHVVVAGSGASAKGVLIGLVALAKQHPDTRVSWLVRRPSVTTTFAGSGQDELPARGELGQRARDAVENGPVTTRNSFRTARVDLGEDGRLTLTSDRGAQVTDVDEVVVLTGFRPDLSFLSELRLDLDPVLESPRTLAPLIDPNEHSCGTVYPHGAAELAQPEPGFYPVGIKSYGRATSFLALTGFEQTRSVAAAIAGDHEAAARVELVLPDTGVCGGAGTFEDATATDGAGCCGTSSEPELLTLGRPSRT